MTKRTKMGYEEDLDAVFNIAVQAAKSAGEHMKANIGHAVEKTKSSKDDLVTIVDKQCQEMVESAIKEAFPTHAFLGEEDVAPGSEASCAALEKAIGEEWLWICDPIDGTTNFVHHRPASVVSIAAAYQGTVVVGVIYDPYRDECFTAKKGQGAHLNLKDMTISKEPSISEAIIGFGIGTKASVRLPMLRCVSLFTEECRGIRLQGSAALELAWVSCGRQTAFYELDLNSWDVAAGILLVKEAGGRVVDSEGKEVTLRSRHVVACNASQGIQTSILQSIASASACTPQNI